MLKKWFYIMSLLFTITAGSFFLPQFLILLLDSDTENRTVLSYGKAYKLDAYFHHQRRNHPVGSSLWLTNTTSLIDTNPQYTLELADYYSKVQQESKAIFWYQQAIKRGFENVRPTLAQLFFNQKNYQQVKALLLPLVNYSDKGDVEKSLVLLTKIALIEGDLAVVESLSKALKKLNQQHALLIELKKYNVFPQFITSKAITNKTEQKSTTEVKNLKTDCVASVQFFATNLADLRYTTHLIEQIESRPLSRYSCFAPVRYIPLNTLACHHDNNEAITCDETIWQEYEAEVGARYIGVLVPQGGAKVHNGIMYLDSGDTVDVFAHELAHLLGFIDEYTLPINHSRCSQIQEDAFSHNVVVLAKEYRGNKVEIRNTILSQLPWGSFIKDETPIMINKGNKWLIGTPNTHKEEIGLFNSDTCQKVSFAQSVNLQAFKPLAKRTSLNYFELEFPMIYQRLLEKDTKKFLMPSFHRNIKKALTN
jgi:tetratricopeptide (TPR) repeat protein